MHIQIGTSSTACLSQAGVYSHTDHETCVSSPVEHGTSLQKLTAFFFGKNTKYTVFGTDENTCMYNNVVKMEIFSARGTHFLQAQQGQCC